MTVELHPTKLAYQLYLLNWAALTALAVFEAVSLPLAGLYLEIDREAWSGLVFSIGLVASGHFLLSKNCVRLGFAALSIAHFCFLSLLGAMLTYIAASANLPLQDALLDHWDRGMGLDWAAYYRFMTVSPQLVPYACLAYAAIAVPPFGVPLVLGLTGHHVRLQRFIMATLTTLVVVAIISAFVPAIGTYAIYELPTEFASFKATGYLIQLERLPEVRSGNLHGLSISKIGGIVTFPSFHAAASVHALWAWWGVWWMRPLALLMCGGTLIATPLFGGHYFIDVLAGVAVACVAIGLTSEVQKRPFAPLVARSPLPAARA